MGAGIYSRYNQESTQYIQDPGAVLPFKDNILLVANNNFISFLDLTKGFPFGTDSFEEHYIDLTFQRQ